MSFNLPVEIWCKIFSSLDLEDLCRARAVCRTWWDLINCDHLWRPKLLERRITEHCIITETLDNADAKSLQNCDWANICFKYYDTAIRNWTLWAATRTECPPSTEYVLIYLPYMLKTFDPYSVVEVQRLSNGMFAPWAKIPLPQDNEEGCYEPQMSCSDAFAVSKNNYTVVFRLRDGAFCFEKALAFIDGSLVSCSDESKAPGFVRDSYRRRLDGGLGMVSCLAVFQDVVWIYETSMDVLVVWDYLKSEIKLKLDSSNLNGLSIVESPLVQTTESRVYFILPGEVSIYSPHGQRLWFYKQKLMDYPCSNFCCNRVGCGFIERNHSVQRAIYYDMSKVSLIHLKVINPITIALDEYCGFAYCLFLRDKSLNIVCSSTLSGELLWESEVCPLLKYEHYELSNRDNFSYLFLDVKIRVILKKYIVIQGLGNGLFSRGFVSVFSTTCRKIIWCHNFHPAKIVHLSNNFIVTKDRYPRGGMRYKFLVYNFLLSNDASPRIIMESMT